MERAGTDPEEASFKAAYRHKRLAPPSAKPVAQAIHRLLARRGYGRVQAASQWQAAWEQAVGPALAAVSRPKEVRREVLEVVVAHSAAAQELALAAPRVLAKLAELMPQQPVRRLRYRVGPLM
jgi:predicted nucleic acid-binding Zn ribbon protein